MLKIIAEAILPLHLYSCCVNSEYTATRKLKQISNAFKQDSNPELPGKYRLIFFLVAIFYHLEEFFRLPGNIYSSTSFIYTNHARFIKVREELKEQRICAQH